MVGIRGWEFCLGSQNSIECHSRVCPAFRDRPEVQSEAAGAGTVQHQRDRLWKHVPVVRALDKGGDTGHIRGFAARWHDYGILGRGAPSLVGSEGEISKGAGALQASSDPCHHRLPFPEAKSAVKLRGRSKFGPPMIWNDVVPVPELPRPGGRSQKTRPETIVEHLLSHVRFCIAGSPFSGKERLVACLQVREIRDQIACVLMGLIVVEADLRQRFARRRSAGGNQVVVDVDGAQDRCHLFVPGDDVAKAVFHFLDILYFVEQLKAQQVRRISPAGSNVAIFRTGQAPRLRIGKKISRMRQKAAIFGIERIIFPVWIDPFGVLAVMLQRHLNVDAVLLRGFQDRVPFPGRVQQKDATCRIFRFVRRPFQSLAIPICHPDPRPVHVRGSHFLENLGIVTCFLTCPGNVHPQRVVSPAIAEHKSLSRQRVAPNKAGGTGRGAAETGRCQVFRGECSPATPNTQTVSTGCIGSVAHPPAITVPERRGGDTSSVRPGEKHLDIVLRRIKGIADLIWKRERSLELAVLRHARHRPRRSRHGGDAAGQQQACHRVKEFGFHQLSIPHGRAAVNPF